LFIKGTLIGLGDYKVTSTTNQEGYLKTIRLLNPKSDDQLTYKFYQNEKDLTNAFKLGEVDQINISQIPPEFNSWPNISINKKIDTDKYSAIFLNTEKLSQKSIRQALAYATPKTQDKNQRCLGPISPISWAYNQNIKDYNFNPTRSKELFDIKTLPEIKLLVTDRKLVGLAQTISDAWTKVLGIKTDITVLNQTSDLNNFDAILAFGQIPVDPDQFTYWHSTQSQTNVTKLNNPRIDKLLEEGRNSFDLIERKQIYQDFQRYLLEESPAIFLEFPTTYTISRVK
jgi:peptide/nickel transport system substrate-binding protein